LYQVGDLFKLNIKLRCQKIRKRRRRYRGFVETLGV